MNKAETLNDIERTIGFVPQWLGGLPEDSIAAEWSLVKTLEMSEAAVPKKYKALIGLAVAAQMQCPYRVAFYGEAAKLYGASPAEIEETAHITKQSAGWSAYLQALQIDLDDFKREAREMFDALAAQNKVA